MNAFNKKKILIISAHADDEAFGMGGTLARLCDLQGTILYWLITTRIWEPKWDKHKIVKREQAITSVINKINIKENIIWDYKDNCLDQIPINELQERMISVLDTIKPNIIFTPSPWDFNLEHRLIFEILEMSTKAYYSSYIEEIMAYEIPSSTEASFTSYRNFVCNVYVDITNYISHKLELMSFYDTELHDSPHPRSIEYVKSLAIKRGGESGLKYAEAYHLLRKTIK